MSKCDLEIIFRKRGLSRFLSHLDLMRSFEQACRRADLPVRFTQGFHPKVKLSSPRALALGTESECEVLVIGFEEDVDPVHVRERLTGHLPEGVEVLAAHPPRSWAGEVREVYEVRWPDGPPPFDEPHLAALLVRDELLVERKGKNGRKNTMNVRPMLVALEWDEGVLRLELASQQRRQAKVREILAFLAREAGGDPDDLGVFSVMKRTLEPLPDRGGTEPASGEGS